jgi:hypothetical protein
MSPGPPAEEAIERSAPLPTINAREDIYPDTTDPIDKSPSFIETSSERVG